MRASISKCLFRCLFVGLLIIVALQMLISGQVPPPTEVKLKASHSDETQRFDSNVSGLSVLSYSLFGTKTKYSLGMIGTAKQALIVYPEWEIRVYHDDQIPQPVLQALSNLTRVKLMDVTKELPPWVAHDVNPMCWRFLVASDPKVDKYAIRDADAQPTAREKMAVDEWARSKSSFHIMRDHPAHNPHGFAIILGGMWGGRKNSVPNMEELLKDYYVKNKNNSSRKASGAFKYADDQDFLWRYVLPLAQNDSLQHDSYYCNESGGIAFPISREEAGNELEFVGNAFNRVKTGKSEGAVYRDNRLFQMEMVERYSHCLQMRQNITDYLELTQGSSSVLLSTPYIGNVGKASTELWEETKKGWSSSIQSQPKQ